MTKIKKKITKKQEPKQKQTNNNNKKIKMKRVPQNYHQQF